MRLRSSLSNLGSVFLDLDMFERSEVKNTVVGVKMSGPLPFTVAYVAQLSFQMRMIRQSHSNDLRNVG